MEEIKRSNKSVLDLELNLALKENKCSKSGVPNLWDLMPDGLWWSCCDNNRYKVQGRCNVLESS